MTARERLKRIICSRKSAKASGGKSGLHFRRQRRYATCQMNADASQPASLPATARPGASLSVAFIALLRRDFSIACRRPGELLHPLLFFVIVVSLFPVALSPDPAFLGKIAPALLWVAALLATLLALPGLFTTDYEDGSLEQLLLSPHPATVLVSAKVLVHWLITGVPLIIAAPLLAEMLHLPRHALPELLGSLLLGTPVMSLVGAIGAALTVAARKSGALLALLILPLYIPILIFGAGAVRAATLGIDPAGQLLLLGAMLLLAIALTPLTMVAALRAALN